MDEFKIVFYIVIAIGWFIYKNYQKVQKNRPKTIEPPKMQPSTFVKEKTMEKIPIEKIKKQKQFISGKQSEIKKGFEEYNKTKEAKPVLKNEIKRKTITSPFLSMDTVHQIPDTNKDAETNMTKKEISEEEIFDLKKFDIRTAIIYSEILKRPQI